MASVNMRDRVPAVSGTSSRARYGGHVARCRQAIAFIAGRLISRARVWRHQQCHLHYAREIRGFEMRCRGVTGVGAAASASFPASMRHRHRAVTGASILHVWLKEIGQALINDGR